MKRYEGIYGAYMTLCEEENREMPEKAVVLIFPGGGYSWLSARESTPVELALHRAGFKAAVLYYDTDSEILGLTPVKQAAWGVAKLKELYPGHKVYVLGFSAGSHCAGSLAVHWNHRDWKGEALFDDVTEYLEGHADAPLIPLSDSSLRTAGCAGDAAAARRFRPDRAVLSYPVITAGPFAHFGSFERLTGLSEEELKKLAGGETGDGSLSSYSDKSASCLKKETENRPLSPLSWFSLETQVDETAPPVFLWHTASDESVPVQNSLLFAGALAVAKVPFELHIYPFGPHGLSLATKEVEDPEKNRFADPHVAEWFGTMVKWLREVQA